MVLSRLHYIQLYRHFYGSGSVPAEQPHNPTPILGVKVLQLGTGCGHEFDWNTLNPLRNGKPGSPANAKQIKFGAF